MGYDPVTEIRSRISATQGSPPRVETSQDHRYSVFKVRRSLETQRKRGDGLPSPLGFAHHKYVVVYPLALRILVPSGVFKIIPYYRVPPPPVKELYWSSRYKTLSPFIDGRIDAETHSESGSRAPGADGCCYTSLPRSAAEHDARPTRSGFQRCHKTLPDGCGERARRAH